MDRPGARVVGRGIIRDVSALIASDWSLASWGAQRGCKGTAASKHSGRFCGDSRVGLGVFNSIGHPGWHSEHDPRGEVAGMPVMSLHLARPAPSSSIDPSGSDA